LVLVLKVDLDPVRDVKRPGAFTGAGLVVVEPPGVRRIGESLISSGTRSGGSAIFCMALISVLLISLSI
jgi:hypothetical protein